MNHAEKRLWLLNKMIAERENYEGMEIPADAKGQRDLLRALMNVRVAAPADGEFLSVQDEYLREAIADKGVTRIDDLAPVRDGLYLWQGDITTLACDAIVNAANSGMTGCYQPLHNCIDNPIPLQITRGFSSFTKESA